MVRHRRKKSQWGKALDGVEDAAKIARETKEIEDKKAVFYEDDADLFGEAPVSKPQKKAPKDPKRMRNSDLASNIAKLDAEKRAPKPWLRKTSSVYDPWAEEAPAKTTVTARSSKFDTISVRNAPSINAVDPDAVRTEPHENKPRLCKEKFAELDAGKGQVSTMRQAAADDITLTKRMFNSLQAKGAIEARSKKGYKTNKRLKVKYPTIRSRRITE